MKRVTKWHILTIGLLILALGMLALWFGFFFRTNSIDKILIIFAGSMLILVSSIFFVLFALSFGKKYNVFLYNKKLKREDNVDDLTIERVCEFLDLYLGIVLSNKKYITFYDYYNDNFLASVPEKYHPLLLMRLLLIWIENNNDEKWKQFAEADKSNVDVIVDVLSNCGEFVISSRLQYLRASYNGEDKDIKEFFLNNVEYLRGFILNYVKHNMHKFD